MAESWHQVRRGGGVPLLAIHGNGVDHRRRLPLDGVLAEPKMWERIYVDLPGFGQTTPLAGVGGLTEIAEALVAYVDELVGPRPFAVIGSSMGGLLERYLATRFKGRVVGLALIAPVVDPDAPQRTVPAPSVVERDTQVLASLSDADRREFEGVAVLQNAVGWRAFREFALPGIRAANSAAMQRLSDNYFLPSPRPAQWNVSMRRY